MTATRSDSAPNFQKLNAMADVAVGQIRQDMVQYLKDHSSVNELLKKDDYGRIIGQTMSGGVAGKLSQPLCRRVGDTIGLGIGVAVGAFTPPPFEVAGAFIGGQLGRSGTEFGCNLLMQGLGRAMWVDLSDRKKEVELTQAKQALSDHYEQSRGRVLTKLLSTQSQESQLYLKDQFNRSIEQQSFYSLLTDDKKQVVTTERDQHRNMLDQQTMSYRAFIKRSDEMDKVTLSYVQRVHDVLTNTASTVTVTEKMVAENNTFLKDYRVKADSLDKITQYKLNAILHEQKLYNRNLKKVLANQDLQEKRYNEQLQRDAEIAKYRGIEAGFNFIGQLGAVTNNKTIASIGSIGAAAASIAFNAAMISGNITGIALSGWGLAVPYVGIAMAGLSLVSTFMAKKKKNDDPYMQALIALSNQLNEMNIEIQERIIHLEERMVDLFRDLQNIITAQASLIKTMTSDGFNAINFKLDGMQADLNRLSSLVRKGLSANYLQEFNGAISAIDQYSQMKVDRVHDIEMKLVVLTTWLTSTACLKDTNGYWCLPDNMTAQNAFASANMREHQALLDDNLDGRLGYVGQLLSLIPGANFNNVSWQDLPNMKLFVNGLDAYVQGRMRMGASAARNMDPENLSLGKIQAVAENGLRFMQQLQANDRAIFLVLLAQYEAVYTRLKQSLVEAARNRLQTGTVSGFEFQAHDAVSQNNPWPQQISGNPFEPVLNKLTTQQGLTMPRLIQKALNLGVGEIITTYTASIVGASYGTQAFDDWKANHWIMSKGATFNIQIVYQHQSHQHLLYTLIGTVSQQKYGETGTIRSKHNIRHNEIAADYNNQVNTANLENGNDYLTRVWPTALMSNADENKSDVPTNLKSAIINGIVERCISNHQVFPQDRQVIINKIMAQPDLLKGLPDDLDHLKTLMVRIQKLSGIPIASEIQALWGKAEFNTNVNNYQLLSQTISSLRPAIQALRFRSRLPIHPVVQSLNYAIQLINVLKHHESMQSYLAKSELSEALQVDEDIIFSAERLQCDFTTASELGSGSFGKVYRASDTQTEQPVAVKLLFPGAKLLDAARGELQVIGHLAQQDQHSPYLVTMYGVTRVNERDAIVMEYVPNHTLDYHLYDSETPLTELQRDRIAKGIISGIAYLHERNIVHGDLKTANVLLTDQLEAKIADYGLAQVAANTQTTSTASQSTKTLAGTFHYLAPEFFQSDATGHPTNKTDIYALGVILWQMLTDKKPFAEMNGTHAMIVTYWVKALNNVPVKDYFEVSEQTTSTHFHRLFKPIMKDCRAIESENRPTAEMLKLRVSVGR